VIVTEPVLVIGFNRPELLARVIASLREVQPKRLFIAIDGPRANHPEDHEKVQLCRSLVKQINWDCAVTTLFHDSNLGCGLGVTTALSWFFSHVDRGIILEDDILPDPSFFGFCSELLDRYAEDERVFGISGCNFVPRSQQTYPDADYRFSRVAHIWGWATWRRSWASYRFDLEGWLRMLPLQRLWVSSGKSITGSLFWAMTFELMARKHVDTWDAQLVFAAMRQGQFMATANTNLVENIGFGQDATHTLRAVEIETRGSIMLPTTPVPVQVDERADAWTRRHHFHASIPGIAHQSLTFMRRKWRAAA